MAEASAMEEMETSDIPLTISAKYVPTWGIWEGVRELVQNWHDGVLKTFEDETTLEQGTLRFEKYQTKDNYRCVAQMRSMTSTLSDIIRKAMSKELESPEEFEEAFLQEMDLDELRPALGHIFYDKKRKTLSLVNYRTLIRKDSLLVGSTSKSLHHETIGQFGEGMKVGALALVREGVTVLVETGDERWQFVVTHQRVFTEDVLAVKITDRDKRFNFPSPPQTLDITNDDVCVQLYPIEEASWMSYLKRFLFLEGPSNVVETELGSLILDHSHSGNMFVRQVWIRSMKNEKLLKGVDLKKLELDRDRRCAANFLEVEHLINNIWTRAVKKRPELHADYFHMLKEKSQSCDVKYARYHLDDTESIQLIAAMFFQSYGEEAYPVLDTVTHDTLHRLEQDFHRRTVVVDQNLHTILQKSLKLMQVNEMLASRHNKVKTMAELTNDEMTVYHHAMSLIRILEPNFPVEKIDLINDTESEISKSHQTRDSHYEVPLWMLSNSQVHLKQRKKCGDHHGRKCVCAAVYLALQLLNKHPAQIHNPVIRFYILLNTLEAQRSAGSPYYCSFIHLTPTLTAEQRKHFSDSLKGKEKELLEKKQHFEVQLKQKNSEHDLKISTMKKQLEESNARATQADLQVYETMKTTQKEFDDMRKRHKLAFEKMGVHYERLAKDLISRHDELLKQKRHIDEILEKDIKNADDAKRFHSTKLRELSTRLTWLKDIVVENLKRAYQVYQVKEGLEDLPQSVRDVIIKIEEPFQAKMAYKDIKCNVCMSKEKKVLLLNCHHLPICEDCADKLVKEGKPCPICRGKIEEKMPVKMPNKELIHEVEEMDTFSPAATEQDHSIAEP